MTGGDVFPLSLHLFPYLQLGKENKGDPFRRPRRLAEGQQHVRDRQVGPRSQAARRLCARLFASAPFIHSPTPPPYTRRDSTGSYLLPYSW